MTSDNNVAVPTLPKFSSSSLYSSSSNVPKEPKDGGHESDKENVGTNDKEKSHDKFAADKELHNTQQDTDKSKSEQDRSNGDQTSKKEDTRKSSDVVKSSSFSIASFKSTLFNKPSLSAVETAVETSNKTVETETKTDNNTSSVTSSQAAPVTSAPKISGLRFGSSLFAKHAKVDGDINMEDFEDNLNDSQSQKAIAESMALLSKNKQLSSQQHSDSAFTTAINEGTNKVSGEENNKAKASFQERSLALDFASMLSNKPTKSVRLPNGKQFQLKPKRTSIFDKPSNIDNIDLKLNYGIDINEIYNDMEAHEASYNESQRATVQKKRKKRLGRGPLWVEKWRPKGFLDLVGNEKPNRLAMRWLRQWSSVIFGEDISKEFNNLPFNRYNNNKNFSHPSDPNATQQQADPLNRPAKKILLLHGPPGIGKTTIAHLIAKHLRYELLEINASDERAGQHVKDKIYNALGSHTFSGMPTCIVADEVDGGSENGFIKVLVDLVYKDIKATKNLIYNKGARNEKAKKKDKDGRLLLRPIIAICNDLYSPVLEKLRPHCEVVAFKRASEELIKTRLLKICAAEKVPITTKQLSQVVAIGNSDIRSCLNLLQFSGDQIIASGDGADMEQLRAKDTNLSWYRLVELIFKLSLHNSKSETFQKLQRHLASTSSVEKIINGCFQTYPQTVYNDPKLIHKSDQVGDWLYFYDRMYSSKYQQNSELVWYCNQVPLKFYSLFAEANAPRPRDRFSNTSWEYYELQKLNYDICQKAILNNVYMKPTLYSSLKNKNAVVTEILPLLNNFIFNPSFVDNNKVILSNPKDKWKISRLVQLLKEFNFKVENVVNEQGMKAMGLVPVMDSITLFEESNKFRSLDSKRQATLKYLFFEIEKQKNAAVAAAAQLKRKYAETLEEEKEGGATPESANGEETSNKVSNNNGSVDFFRASYASIKKTGTDGESTEGSGKSNNKGADLKVWVKYHEGFSNAVRKNVTWNELWL